jgi:hypothetical protein
MRGAFLLARRIGGMRAAKLDRASGFMLKSNVGIKVARLIGRFAPLLFVCNQPFTEEVGIFCESQKKIE